MTVDLVVVGGGIAGLVAAYDAARAGMRVRVLDAGAEVGGLLRRGSVGGVDVDLGAESFATRTPAAAELAAELGLEVCSPSAAAAHLVWHDGARTERAPLPRATVLGIPADPLATDVVRIVGETAARRAAAEEPATLSGPEPTLFDLVSARCGTGLATGLVDPLCRSVYSRPASAVRLSQVHPGLWDAFLACGSLRGAARQVAADTPAGGAVGGIVGGMWQLPRALRAAAEAVGAEVLTGTTAQSLRPGAVLTDQGTHRAAAIVLAVSPAAARGLLGASAAPAPSVRVVSALVRSHALDSHPVGPGAIVAEGVPSAAKALTHTSAKWAWAAAPDHHLVRLSARDAAVGLDTPEALAAEIGMLTGIAPEQFTVDAVTSATWTDAVATSPLSSETIAAAAADGIHLTGAVIAGTGLASVIPHARRVAQSFSLTPTTARSTA